MEIDNEPFPMPRVSRWELIAASIKTEFTYATLRNTEPAISALMESD